MEIYSPIVIENLFPATVSLEIFQDNSNLFSGKIGKGGVIHLTNCRPESEIKFQLSVKGENLLYEMDIIFNFRLRILNKGSTKIGFPGEGFYFFKTSATISFSRGILPRNFRRKSLYYEKKYQEENLDSILKIGNINQFFEK